MAKTTTDHNPIRKWAEDRGGKPAAVHTTHDGDTGIIRIMFPEAPRSENDNLTEISWDEFFDKFEEKDLALVYEEDSAFNKLVGRNA